MLCIKREVRIIRQWCREMKIVKRGEKCYEKSMKRLESGWQILMTGDLKICRTFSPINSNRFNFIVTHSASGPKGCCVELKCFFLLLCCFEIVSGEASKKLLSYCKMLFFIIIFKGSFEIDDRREGKRGILLLSRGIQPWHAFIYKINVVHTFRCWLGLKRNLVGAKTFEIKLQICTLICFLQ